MNEYYRNEEYNNDNLRNEEFNGDSIRNDVTCSFPEHDYYEHNSMQGDGNDSTDSESLDARNILNNIRIKISTMSLLHI